MHRRAFVITASSISIPMGSLNAFAMALKLFDLMYLQRVHPPTDVSLKELSLKRKERTGKLDMVAATLLLQTYLDK